MKQSYLLAVVAAVVVANANAKAISNVDVIENPESFGRPIDWFKCKNLLPEVHAHPEACDKYVVCKLKKAYELDCVQAGPIRLLYDEKMKICVPSNFVKCDRGVTDAPTEEPTEVTTDPPSTTTQAPTEVTTEKPTEAPTQEPTEEPTEVPTQAPTEEPTEAPTQEPTEEPTEAPTQPPTEEPTESPTQEPTEEPTEVPTQPPTEEPTEAPTEVPTEVPTQEPTDPPSTTTQEPTEVPTDEPTQAPTEEPTEPTEAPTTTEPPTNPPKPGDPCEPNACKNIGYCQSYLRCDKETEKWVQEECGDGMFWNPDNGSVHGGNCDFLENLSDEVEQGYRKDPECLACFWKATGECERDYLYQAPDQINRNVQTLTCSQGLIFSQGKETCQRCEDVKKSSGSACC